MPEIYERPGRSFLKVAADQPTPACGQRVVFMDDCQQAIPSQPSRKWIDCEGNVVLVPRHTTRSTNPKQNPLQPHGGYAHTIERMKLAEGFVDYMTGHHDPATLRSYVVQFPNEKGLLDGQPSESISEAALLVSWPEHRERLILARQGRHVLDDAPYRDKAQDMLDKELRGMSRAVSAGIAEGFALAVKQVAGTDARKPARAAKGEE